MDREGSSTSEFEKICLAGEESSDEEPETSELRLCDHGDQHTYIQTEQPSIAIKLNLDLNNTLWIQKKSNPILCLSEQSPDFSNTFSLLESGPNDQQSSVECDDNAARLSCGLR